MSLIKSIATFGGLTLISRVTGFLRDMTLANFLGAGAMADAFFVAFKLPNLFRSLFAEGAFTSAFVPLFSQKMVAEGKKKSIFFAAQAMAILIVIVGLFVVLFEIFMPYVVTVLAPGFSKDSDKAILTVDLCRITFPFLLLISIVSFQGGILNSFEKFAAPASAPIILNFTMIFSCFVFVPFMPSTAHGIAMGITFAGFLEIIWLYLALKKIDVKIHPYIKIFKILHNPEIRLLFKRIAPGVVGAGIYQINMAVDTILVSLLGTGAISWLYYANRLQQLPLGVVGAAISVALLPILSKALKSGQMQQAKETQDKAVEYGLMLSLPAAVLLIVLARPIVTLLFEHGKFLSNDSLNTAYAVMVYAVGLPFYVMTKSLMPNFFARGDTVTPVKYGAVVFITNLIFNLILMQFMGHVGIATATTVAAFVSLIQYVMGLKKRNYWSFSKELCFKMIKIAVSSLLMGLFVWFFGYLININSVSSNIYLFFYLGGLGVIAIAFFVFFATILKVLNVKEILRMARRKNGRA